MENINDIMDLMKRCPIKTLVVGWTEDEKIKAVCKGESPLETLKVILTLLESVSEAIMRRGSTADELTELLSAGLATVIARVVTGGEQDESD